MCAEVSVEFISFRLLACGRNYTQNSLPREAHDYALLVCESLGLQKQQQHNEPRSTLMVVTDYAKK
jgi:hypothetical protein